MSNEEHAARLEGLLGQMEGDGRLSDSIRAGAAALREANRWRPIAEAAPPTRVELWWPYWATSVQNGFLRENGRWCSSCVECDDPDLPGPTHWRPMSDPPEGA